MHENGKFLAAISVRKGFAIDIGIFPANPPKIVGDRSIAMGPLFEPYSMRNMRRIMDEFGQSDDDREIARKWGNLCRHYGPEMVIRCNPPTVRGFAKIADNRSTPMAIFLGGNRKLVFAEFGGILAPQTRDGALREHGEPLAPSNVRKGSRRKSGDYRRPPPRSRVIARPPGGPISASIRG